VDRPGLEDRLEILTLHAQRLVLDTQINLRVVAQRTAGLVGADLANICNEAAILAVRDHADRITMKHLESAIDRVLAGPEKKSLVLTQDEKQRVACHEAGHALVAAVLPNAQPVQKVSIIPRGSGVLGYTLQLPFEERFLSTEAELQVQLSVLMAGRKAEHLKFGTYSNGAKNDLESATALARKMVCEWGMSPQLGPVTLGKWQRLRYLEPEGTEERNYSDHTAQRIDQEIKALLLAAEDSAGKLLVFHQKALEEMMSILIEQEVIDGQTIMQLVKREVNALKA
jgi:cell division protease FtsH